MSLEFSPTLSSQKSSQIYSLSLGISYLAGIQLWQIPFSDGFDALPRAELHNLRTDLILPSFWL